MKKIILPILLIIGLLSCGNKNTSYKKYYFPYANFIQPKVYKYVERTDSNNIMYWHFKTTVTGTDTTFTSFMLNSKFQLVSIFQNNITSDGSYLKEMLVSIGDSSKMVKCLVKDNEIFQWNMKPKQKLTFSFSIGNSDGSQTEEVVTERTIDSQKEKKRFNGNEYECILVNDFSMLNHKTANRTASEEQYRNSYFAEQIGLLEFETLNANGKNTYFSLQKIMNEKEWKLLAPTQSDSSNAVTQ